MSERVCLRCDWTGEEEGSTCPRCGALLYALDRPEQTEPDEDDGNDAQWVPAAAAGRRGAVAVVALIVVAGAAFGLIRLNTPDPAALAEVEGQASPSVSQVPTGDGSPSASSPTVSMEPEVCSREAGTSSLPEQPNGSEPDLTGALTADYRFRNSLASSVGGLDLVETGPGRIGFADEAVLGQRRAVLRFAGGCGLSLAPASAVIDGSVYTIELVFRFDLLGNYVKIIDFEGASDDAGLYTFDGRLILFPKPMRSQEALEVDAYAQIVLTRDASAMIVVYLDGVRQFSFRDTDRYAVVDENDTLLFFRDDATTDTEFSSGAVARIRLYDRALAENEVADLALS